MEPEVKELKPSTLGSKEHWDSAYEQELRDYTEDGVSGEDWFGPAIGKKIVQYLKQDASITLSDPILDLGCGCGAVMVILHEAGFCNLTGIDYSEKAIDLCRAVAKDNGIEAKLQVVDLVDGNCDSIGQFSVCIDKGTYDAISLTPDRCQAEARLKYLQNVHNLLSEAGIFIMASCNWTRAEIESHSTAFFSIVGSIETTKFAFGGAIGNDVTIVVMKKKCI